MTDNRSQRLAGEVAGWGCSLLFAALVALSVAAVLVGGWKLLAWLLAL